MRELREAQRRVETILESITDAFVAVDREWRYTYVNDRALRRLEAWRGRALTREEILGRSMWELFPDAVGTEVEQRLRAAMGARDPVEFELYFAPTDEWVEARAYPSPSGLSVYYRNVSARRRAEEALREAQDQRAIADRRLEDVREAERSRLARDLHDEALQGLTHALAVTDRHAPGRDDEVHAILKQVGRQLRGAIYDLRLERDVECPFSDALRELVEVNREMAPTCEVTLETDDELPSESLGPAATELLRIIGEALTNACRHAAAEHIIVRVTGPQTRLSVEVIDDGRGFDVDRQPPAPHGHGLRGMRERAEHLGARLDIRSNEAGTTVRLQVALSAA
jgi:PAS domain S-box-containing protein